MKQQNQDRRGLRLSAAAGSPLRIARRLEAILITWSAALCFAGALQARTILSIVGPATVCAGATNSYTVNGAAQSSVFQWSIGTINTAGAAIVGSTTGATVYLTATTNGLFVLQCLLGNSFTNETLTMQVSVSTVHGGTPLTNQTVCPGTDAAFTTTIIGSGDYSIIWSKDGDVLLGATNTSLALTGVEATNAGLYSVEIDSSCGSVTYSATLTVLPAAGLVAPSNLVLECLGEVPAPDPNGVLATNAVSVFFIQDTATTNGCAITINRTYGGVDSCGNTSTCAQVILVQPTQPPVLIAPSNMVVEAGVAWSFGTPTFTDSCGGSNVTLIVSGTVTNPFAG